MKAPSKRTIIIAVIVAVVLLAVVFLIPLPLLGVQSYNVDVSISMSEAGALGFEYYTVNGVAATQGSGSTLAQLVDPSLGFTGPSLTTGYVAQVCVGSHCSSASETKILANIIPNYNSVSDTLTVSGVSPGTYTVTGTLWVNGASQGTATSSVTVTS
jgi:hypothetical protein